MRKALLLGLLKACTHVISLAVPSAMAYKYSNTQLWDTAVKYFAYLVDFLWPSSWWVNAHCALASPFLVWCSCYELNPEQVLAIDKVKCECVMCWRKGKHEVVIEVIFSRVVWALHVLFTCQCLVVVHQDTSSSSSHFVLENNFACNYLFGILIK